MTERDVKTLSFTFFLSPTTSLLSLWSVKHWSLQLELAGVKCKRKPDGSLIEARGGLSFLLLINSRPSPCLTIP